MLKTFRENFKHLKWVLWLVIGVFVVFVFVDWGMGTTVPGGRDTDVAATVGGKKITRAEFVREYQARENQYRQMFQGKFSPEMARMMKLPEQVMNSLIDRQLMKLEAAHLGIAVTDEELSHRILSLTGSDQKPLFMKDGAFIGEVAYKRLLASNNLTPASFEAEMKEQIVLEKLNRLLTQSAFVSDDEIQDEYQNRNLKAKISYILKPFEILPPGGAEADAEAEARFKKDPNAYLSPEKRKVKYLLVDRAKIAAATVVSEDEVKADYNNNLDSYKLPEQVRARHILYKVDASDPKSDAIAKGKAEAALAKLKGGADFTALAKAESEDPSAKGTDTAPGNGGDLGLFTRDRMVKEFSDAAFGADVNQIVGPVKTSYGYHVIQTLAKETPRVQRIDEVAGQIRARLQQQRAADEVKRLAADLQEKLTKIGRPSDDDMRKLTSANVTFNETEFFAKTDQPAGVGGSPTFVNEAFALTVGELGKQPATTDRGEAVLKLVEIKKPGVPKFEEVKLRIVGELKREKEKAKSLEAVTQALAEAGSIDAAADKLGVKVQTSDEFAKAGPIGALGAHKPLLDAVFAAKVGDTSAPIAVPDRGTVVFKVLSKTELDKAALEKEREAMRSQLQGQKANRLIQSMLTRRRGEMNVEMNKELLTRLSG